ncbi:hypothetical protein ACA910_020195 [Epithemia clementina (nom. ined.)]
MHLAVQGPHRPRPLKPFSCFEVAAAPCGTFDYNTTTNTSSTLAPGGGGARSAPPPPLRSNVTGPAPTGGGNPPPPPAAGAPGDAPLHEICEQDFSCPSSYNRNIPHLPPRWSCSSSFNACATNDPAVRTSPPPFFVHMYNQLYQQQQQEYHSQQAAMSRARTMTSTTNQEDTATTTATTSTFSWLRTGVPQQNDPAIAPLRSVPNDAAVASEHHNYYHAQPPPATADDMNAHPAIFVQQQSRQPHDAYTRVGSCCTSGTSSSAGTTLRGSTISCENQSPADSASPPPPTTTTRNTGGSPDGVNANDHHTAAAAQTDLFALIDPDEMERIFEDC